VSVRPEFGPTLPSLLAARGVSRRAMAAGLLALVLVAAAVFFGARSLSDDEQLVVHGPPAFNLVYDSSVLHSVPPHAGELARIEGARRDVKVVITARAITVPSYGTGDVVGGYLPLLGEKREAALRAQYGPIDVYDEGKARINRNPGYQIGFSAKAPTGKLFGRDAFVFPDEDNARAGVLLSLRRTVLRRQTAADDDFFKTVKLAFSSFNFGEDQP
jgi:hypothetical protein